MAGGFVASKGLLIGSPPSSDPTAWDPQVACRIAVADHPSTGAGGWAPRFQFPHGHQPKQGHGSVLA
jgi:hypothetical protein